MMFLRPFQGAVGGTIALANSTTATASAPLPENAETVVLFNTSETAVVFFRCEVVSNSTTLGKVAAAAEPGVLGDFPVPPTAQIRVTVGPGYKRFSVIASAEDGMLYITPGAGN